MSGSTAPDYTPIYQEAGEKQAIDPDLLRAQGDVESGQNRFAVSPAGAEGVMQLEPGTAKEMGVQNSFVPEQNIHGGAKYMRAMLDRFGQDPHQALAAYNAGPGGDWSNPETTHYVQSVSDKWNAYREQRLNRGRQQAPADDWISPQAPADDWISPPGQQTAAPPAAPAKAAPPPNVSVPGQGMVGATYNALRRGVVEGTASAVEGAGDIYRHATGADPNSSNAAIDWGKRYTKRAEESYPIDTSNQGMTTNVAGGVGGMLPMVGAAAVAGTAGPAAGVLATTAYVGAQSYASTHDDALAKGSTPEQADQAASLSALTQAGIMALPVGRVLHAMPSLASGLWSTLEGMAKRGAEFAGFNSIGRVADNFVAKNTYDPHRDLMEGVGEAAAEGAITGPIFHIPQAAKTAAEALRRPVANPALANNVQAQQAAAASGQPGGPPQPGAPSSTPSATTPSPPIQGPPIAPMGPPEAPHGPPIAPMGPPEAPASTPVPGAPPHPPQQTLAIIAGGGDPAKTPPTPPPAAATPQPSEPAPRPPRSTTQIQREEGVGYNQAERIRQGEIAAAAQTQASTVQPNAAPVESRAPPSTDVAPPHGPPIAPMGPPEAPHGPPIAPMGPPEAPHGPPIAPMGPELPPVRTPRQIQAEDGVKFGDAVKIHAEEKAASDEAKLPSPVADIPPDSPAAPGEMVQHVTKKGKTLTGTVRTDLDQAGAKALDPFAFRKDGGWFIRAGKDKPPEPPAAAESTSPIKAADMLPNVLGKQKWTDVGKNADGQTVYADPNGVHSTLEDGIRSTEPVSIRPGQGIQVKANADKPAQWQVVPPKGDKTTPQDQPLTPPAAVPAADPDSQWPAPQSPDDPLLANNVDRLREQYGSDGLLSRGIAQMLHEGDAKPAGAARLLDFKKLQGAAELIYGGRLADNAFGRDRLYDAMETGVNRYIAMHPERFAPTGDAAHAKAAAEALAEIKNRMPTQTVRAGDKDKLQQFSTPPEYAYAAAWAANLKPGDHVMEPSAGNGGLLVHALTAGVAETTANEISPQRLTNLRDQGFTRVTNENAEQLHNILPADIRPTAVVMNPPFSSAGDRMGGKMILGIGAQHIEQALQRLEPGGRLVAIVGRGMSMDAPTFRNWWKKIGEQYDVRANVGVGGGIYRKYGTTFATRVLVIDKVPPSGRAVVRNEVEGVDGLIDKLKDVRDDRPATRGDRGSDQQVTGKPTGEGVAGQGESAGEPAGIVRDPTGGMGDRGSGAEQPRPDEPVGPVAGSSGEPDLSVAGAGAEARPPGDAVSAEQPKPEPSRTASQPEPRPVGSDEPAESRGGGAGDTIRPDGSQVGVDPPNPELVKTGVIIPDTEHGGELTESVYENYKPQRVQIEGAKPHPGALVQSAAMASVLPPTPKYNTALPSKLITSGALSDAQLEAIIYAGEAHSQMLEPDDKGVTKRRGFFIGDGTGVGKGRETAGIILDNWMKGNRRAVWVSDKMALGNDAKRDWAGLGGKADDIMPHNKVDAGGDIAAKEGVLFTSYDTLRSKEKIKTTGAPLQPGEPPPTGQSRVDQIVKWLGKDFDGVIAFDEAHNMANAVPTRGARGVKEASQKALAGIELQNRLPNAKVVYVSATGATEVNNLAYADRLGLWGKGTAFADRADFISKIGSGGVAAMELVARDMKSLGQYMARSLSYDGVEYDRILHPLTEDQTVMYDKIADAWQGVMEHFEAAMETTNSGGKGGVSAGVKSAFWGGHQRFFNQLITSMQMPSVIRGVERDVAEGRQAVLQLVNTNEAATDRALEKNRAETGGDELEELDLSPKAQLLQLVDKAFPTQQYETYVDPEGNERKRPVVDSNGQPVHSREALAAKEALLDDLATLRVPDGPLDLLYNHFGPDAVAEVTGRKQRVVNRPDEKGVVRRVEEKRAAQDNIKEAKDFQDAKKRILVFSEAGGTGRSYHAAIDAPSADNRRSHYLVQAGWRADKAVQGFGRTHRTNQASAPIFHLVTTDLEGQKRFISSIARRLGQLGALTKGERKTGDQGMFGLQDNLESDEAKAGLTQLYRDVVDGKVEGITNDTTFKKMGLTLIDPTTGGMRNDPPAMTQFLNRLLSLQSGEQNQLFNAFNTRFADVIDRAQQAGTLDAGTETLRADKITKKREQTVYTDPSTGAETKHVHLETHTKNTPTSFEAIEAGQSRLTGNQPPIAYVRNTRSGRISAVANTTYAKVGANGQITEHYRVANPLEGSFQVKADIAKAQQDKRIELIRDKAQAKALWDAQVAATPAFKTADLHMITGAVLPIWDRLAGAPKIYRLQTDTGERILGRVVDNKEIDRTLQRLGAEGQKVNATAEEVGQKVLQGATATLANGWTIKRSLVAGQQRLELKGWGYRDADQLRQDGLFSERIGSDVRLFIPADKAGEVIDNITKRRPVTEMTGSGEGEQYSAREAPASDTEQFARRKTGKDEAKSPPFDAKGPRVDPSDRTAAHPELHAAMTQMMRFMGLPEKVGLKFVDKITRGGPNGADAVYDKGLITYALDTAAGDAPGKLWHEAIHALMDPALGLLKPSELKALQVGADRWLYDGKRGVARRAELQALAYPEAHMREEAIARMAEEALARGVKPNTLMGGAIQRMRDFARGLGQFFHGQGFKTADDVFNGLMKGDRAQPGSIEAMRSPPAPPETAYQSDRAQDENKTASQDDKPIASARGFDEAYPPEGNKPLSAVLADQQSERYAARRGAVALGKDAADDIKKVFSPTSRGPEARAAELTIRGRTAKLAQSSAQAGHALEAFRHVIGKLPEAEQYAFTDRMERGQAQPNAGLQAVADALRSVLDSRARMIQSLPGNRLSQAKADYMGRAYSNYKEWAAGQQAAAGSQGAGLAAQVGAGMGKRPVQGSGNFLKQRSFEYLSDARAAGLIPVTSNPLEMQILKAREMDKFYHGAKLAEEMKAQGLARWVSFEGYSDAAHNGMVKLDDKMFQPKSVLSPPDHGLVEHGAWFAPEAAGRLFNNYVSSGLRGNTLYDGVRATGNALNSLQLGLSAFHATFITLDTMISRVALGLQQAFSGDVGRGVVNMALGLSPHNIAKAIRDGSKLQAAYLDPATADPFQKKIVDMFTAGGGRIGMDQFFRSSEAGSFFKNLNDLKNPGSVMREAVAMAKDTPLMAPLRLAGRVMDTMMEPIMGQMVPRAKAGVFAHAASDWITKNPNATAEENAAAATKIWDSVDNRMGQLVYDNLFWNKVTKDIAFISTRSVGWNLGTLRELGGGAVDTARAANDIAHLRTPQFTTRMGYSLAMPIVTAVMGAMLTYAYTGKPPSSMIDYFYPPNGQEDGGRNSIPGYIKDVVAYIKNPVQTGLNKLHPLFSMAQQVYQNRDYRGGIIYDKAHDNPVFAYAEYLLNTAMPFSVQSMRKNGSSGQSMLEQTLSFFGIQAAPQSVVNPDKQEKYQAQQDERAYKQRQKEGLWRPLSGS